MKLKGRSFVKDDAGEWHEMDENGNLIPDHLVTKFMQFQVLNYHTLRLNYKKMY